MEHAVSQDLGLGPAIFRGTAVLLAGGTASRRNAARPGQATEQLCAAADGRVTGVYSSLARQPAAKLTHPENANGHARWLLGRFHCPLRRRALDSEAVFGGHRIQRDIDPGARAIADWVRVVVVVAQANTDIRWQVVPRTHTKILASAG